VARRSTALTKPLTKLNQEKKERGEAFDGKINSWDFQYYNTMLKQEKFAIDEDEVRTVAV
jgi:Zn-dependent oligopeptidase